MGSTRLDIPGKQYLEARQTVSSKLTFYPHPIIESHSRAAYLLFGSSHPPLSHDVALKRYGVYVADIVELWLPVRLSMETQQRMTAEVRALIRSLNADLQNMILYGLIGSRYLRSTVMPGPGGTDWIQDLLFKLDDADADLMKLAQAKFSKRYC